MFEEFEIDSNAKCPKTFIRKLGLTKRTLSDLAYLDDGRSIFGEPLTKSLAPIITITGNRFMYRT